MRNIFKQKKTNIAKITHYDPDSLFEPWDYPEPIEDGRVLRFMADDRFVDLIYMAKHGWHTAQKAIVHMSIVHPYYDFKPVIDDEFRVTFNAWQDKRRPMTLTLYEHDGKLIMSNDYEAYWMYRERELEVADCIIIGKFSEKVDIAVYDRPFFIASESVKSPIT